MTLTTPPFYTKFKSLPIVLKQKKKRTTFKKINQSSHKFELLSEIPASSPIFILQVDRDDDDDCVVLFDLWTENLKRNHLHFSLTFGTYVCRHRRSCTVKVAHSFDTWNENGKRDSAQDAEIKYQTHNGHIGKEPLLAPGKEPFRSGPQAKAKKRKLERWWSCRFDNENGPLFHQPMGLRGVKKGIRTKMETLFLDSQLSSCLAFKKVVRSECIIWRAISQSNFPSRWGPPGAVQECERHIHWAYIGKLNQSPSPKDQGIEKKKDPSASSTSTRRQNNKMH